MSAGPGIIGGRTGRPIGANMVATATTGMPGAIIEVSTATSATGLANTVVRAYPAMSIAMALANGITAAGQGSPGMGTTVARRSPATGIIEVTRAEAVITIRDSAIAGAPESPMVTPPDRFLTSRGTAAIQACLRMPSSVVVAEGTRAVAVGTRAVAVAITER